MASSRREKVLHLKEKHSTDMRDVCGQCGEQFEAAQYLLQHQVRVERIKERCHVFTGYFNLQRTVHALRLTKCPHKDCRRFFPLVSAGALRRHLSGYHSAENEAKRAAYKFVCQHCQRRVKTADRLSSHIRDVHPEAGARREKCEFCDFTVPSKRKTALLKRHMRRAHPEHADYIARLEQGYDCLATSLKLYKVLFLTFLLLKYLFRTKERRADLAKRAKVQCLLCPYAATRAGNMARHFVEVHSFDKDSGERADPDPDYPDGCLCPECGEHFVNRHQLMAHVLKVHAMSTGEQCLYCRHRYLNLEEHIEERHQVCKCPFS